MNNISNNIKSDINSLLAQKIHNTKRDLNVCKVGKIESFNKETQTAKVSLMIQAVMQDGAVKDYPVLVDVPVLIMQGSGGYINMPINTGDPCIVIFCDRDIDNWYLTNKKLPPKAPVMHNIKDGFAIVGFNNTQTKFNDYDTSFSLKYKEAQVGVLDNSTVTCKNNQGELTIDDTGLITLKNQNTTLKQILLMLANILQTGVYATQGQEFVVPNTPASLNAAGQAQVTQLITLINQLCG